MEAKPLAISRRAWVLLCATAVLGCKRQAAKLAPVPAEADLPVKELVWRVNGIVHGSAETVRVARGSPLAFGGTMTAPGDWHFSFLGVRQYSGPASAHAPPLEMQRFLFQEVPPKEQEREVFLFIECRKPGDDPSRMPDFTPLSYVVNRKQELLTFSGATFAPQAAGDYSLRLVGAFTPVTPERKALPVGVSPSSTGPIDPLAEIRLEVTK